MPEKPYTVGELLGEGVLQQGWRFGQELTEEEALEQIRSSGTDVRGPIPTLIGYVVEVKEDGSYARAIYRSHDGHYVQLKWRKAK